jgi:hypothetical protein
MSERHSFFLGGKHFQTECDRVAAERSVNCAVLVGGDDAGVGRVEPRRFEEVGRLLRQRFTRATSAMTGAPKAGAAKLGRSRCCATMGL